MKRKKDFLIAMILSAILIPLIPVFLYAEKKEIKNEVKTKLINPWDYFKIQQTTMSKNVKYQGRCPKTNCYIKIYSLKGGKSGCMVIDEFGELYPSVICERTKSGDLYFFGSNNILLVSECEGYALCWWIDMDKVCP